LFCSGVSWAAHKTEIAGRKGLSDIKAFLWRAEFLQLSKRFFGAPSFFNYVIADGIFNLLVPDKTALQGLSTAGMDGFQLQFEFG